MSLPARSPEELVDLRLLFLNLQQTAEPADRSHLANLVILHDEFHPRFNTAFGVVMKPLPRDSNLMDDVRQQAISILLGRLNGGRLAYEDRGTHKFGGWVYRICRNACVDALKMCLQDGERSTVRMDNRRLEQCEACVASEHRLDKLLRGIDTIRDSLLREIMLETASLPPLTLGESANLHGLSLGAVFKLRLKGKAYLRRFFRDELNGGS